ncbi:right-handed parallel beta-helix repeat-containing protein [Paraburkholderia fungorum]|uniref:right-handed parallel beta-helix repeat-containing protein n=1 Tax=Paraburkholderia fungorum TaxID=134537 RepID=UPI0038BAABDB
MGVKSAVKVATTIAMFGAAAWHGSTYAATYYVSSIGNDANNGTSANAPWQTLAKVSGATFIAGDQILFRCGDTFSGQLKISSSGSPGNPITFSSYNPGTSSCTLPVLAGATGQTTWLQAAVLVQDQDNLSFSNLHISNNNTNIPGASLTNVFGIQVLGTGQAGRNLSYYRFQNLLVDQVTTYKWNGNLDAIYTAGISVMNTSTSYPISDIVVSNSTFTNNGRYGAIFADNSTVPNYDITNPILGVQNVGVLNNTCTNNGGSCFMGQRVQNLLIQGNSIVNSGAATPINTTAAVNMYHRGSGAWFVGSQHVAVESNYVSGSYGPDDSSNIHVDAANSDVVVEYNTYYGNFGAGFEVLGGNHHVIYRFNYSANDGQRSQPANFHTGVIYSSTYVPATMGNYTSGVYSDDVWIYNNTIVASNNTNSQAISLAATNMHVYNNIFGSFGGPTIFLYAHSLPSGGVAPSWSNNVFYGAAASAYQNDHYAILKDPKFVDESAAAFTATPSYVNNFKLLSGSPALSAAYMGFTQPVFEAAGTGIFANISPTATKGFFGQPIQSTTWNVGPYQWTGEQ